MRIIENTTDIISGKETSVAIGKFDGIHLGHQKLLQEILNARAGGYLATVFTFAPSPSSLFSGQEEPELLTREEKRRAFAGMGVDLLVEFPMTLQTAATPPEEFVRKILGRGLRARLVAAGNDVSFGRGGSGDWRLLSDLAGECGYRLSLVDKVRYEGREISSSYVRSRLREGDMPTVERLLGHPFYVSGTVMHGKRLGRTLGMPTVNLLPSAQKLLPPSGVYYSRLRLNQKTYDAVTNVGCRPTVSDSGQMSVETYLYDFDQEIYGGYVEVELCAFRRPEMRFSGVEELKEQMSQDILAGRSYWSHRRQPEEIVK